MKMICEKCFRPFLAKETLGQQCKACVRDERLLFEGCVVCGVRESSTVWLSEGKPLCDHCHTNRENVMASIIELLRKESYEDLTKMRALLAMKTQEKIKTKSKN